MQMEGLGALQGKSGQRKSGGSPSAATTSRVFFPGSALHAEEEQGQGSVRGTPCQVIPSPCLSHDALEQLILTMVTKGSVQSRSHSFHQK